MCRSLIGATAHVAARRDTVSLSRKRDGFLAYWKTKFPLLAERLNMPRSHVGRAYGWFERYENLFEPPYGEPYALKGQELMDLSGG